MPSAVFYLFIYLCDRERELQTIVWIPKAHRGQAWARWKPKAGNSAQVSQEGDRGPITWAITTAYQGLY